MALWKKLIGLQTPDPRWYTTGPEMAPGTPNPLQVTYLGTAGFILQDDNRVVVLDPYVSRPGPMALLAPLVPDTALIRETIPQAVLSCSTTF